MLLIADHRGTYLGKLRQNISVALYPLQQLATSPVRWSDQIGTFLSSQTELQAENQRLRMQQLQSAESLQREAVLERDYNAMRQLLGLLPRYAGPPQVVETLYAGRDPFKRSIIVDNGKGSTLIAGSPVIDNDGLVGQVSSVHPLVAEVTLIIDKNFPVPVEVYRTGQRTVAFGTGLSGALEIRYLAVNTDIQVDDILVTSGIDGTYPAGLPVAKVAKVERNGALPFAHIVATPLGGVEKGRYLLVTNHVFTQPDYPETVLPPPPPKKPAR